MNLEYLLSKLNTDELNSIKEMIDSIIYKRIESENKIDAQKTYIPIDKIGLSVRCINALRCNDIDYLNEVSEYSRLGIHKLRNLGKRSIMELDDKLLEFGLSWKPYI